MARDHARLFVHIWTDPDFIDLSAVAKLLYLQLVSQPKLSYAGVLDLAANRWKRAHPDLDVEVVRAALAELHTTRFVVIDHDTEELLVRTFVRNDELYKQPFMLRGALRVAFDTVSPILRAALAVELRRLPAEITGPAPAVAAAELENGARTLPASVTAAMEVRGTGRPAKGRKATRQPAPAEPDTMTGDTGNPVSNPSADPSGIPSTQSRGEGSRESETGVSPLAWEETKVGVPAPARTGAHPRPREDEPAATATGKNAEDAEADVGSVRQVRRAEAERLVTVHCPAQPIRVVQLLRGQVLGLLREGIDAATIAAGLRVWAGKTLPPTWLPELVGELMRARPVPVDAKTQQRELAVARTVEQARAYAVADNDPSPLGRAVRNELPAHADADALQALLDRALAESASQAEDARAGAAA